MTIDDLAAIAPKLSSEALRLALALHVEPRDEDGWVRIDKRGRARICKNLGIASEKFSKYRSELTEVGAISSVSASTFRWLMSDPASNLAHLSTPVLQVDKVDDASKPTAEDENDDYPWLEPKTASEQREREAEPKTSASADALTVLNGEVRPCPHCGRVTTPVAQATPPTEPPTVSPHRFVVDAFDRLYRDANNGARPTWGARQGSIVKDLLKSHAAEEIIRRATIMFTESRRFPAPPYTIFTLRQFFDAFSVSTRKTVAGIVDRDPQKRGATYYGKVTDDV